MELSIIIVNWHSSFFVRKCVKSIYDSMQGISFEIIVVDNASFDDCGEMLTREFQDVQFVQSGRNIGFAGGNNLGFSHSSGSTLLFLNPDTEVIGAAINIMYSTLQSINNAGIVGCKLLNPDLSVQTTSILPYPTLLNQFMDNDYLRKLFPGCKLWGIKPLLLGDKSPVEVDAVSGACIMIKQNVFREVGLFSTDYFMYREDIDLCYKAKSAGWNTFFVSKANIIHFGGRSTNKIGDNWFSAIVMRESALRCFVKTKGKFCGWLYKITTSIAAVLRLLILVMCLTFIRNGDKRNQLKYSFAKWIRIFRWSIGLEKWARKLNGDTTTNLV